MDQETGHATVLLAHPRCRESFEIDTKLADIIKLLWEKELDTICSCEDIGDGVAYINFPDYHEACVAFRTMANFARVHGFREGEDELDVTVSMAFSSSSEETQVQIAPNTILPELEKYMRQAWFTGGEER